MAAEGGRRSYSTRKDRDWRSVSHPIIRTDPETPRKSLNFDRGKILSIIGVETKEGDALIDALKGYMIHPDAKYHVQERMGDVVVWTTAAHIISRLWRTCPRTTGTCRSRTTAPRAGSRPNSRGGAGNPRAGAARLYSRSVWRQFEGIGTVNWAPSLSGLKIFFKLNQVVRDHHRSQRKHIS